MEIKTVIDTAKCAEKMAIAKEAIEANITRYNTALGEDSIESIAKIEAEMAEDEKDYRNYSMQKTFAELAATEKPMYAAICKYSYPAIRHQVKNVNVGGITTQLCTLTERDIPIDLYAFDRFCDGKASHDESWVYMVQKFNFLNCCRVASSLGIDPHIISDSYAMDEISKAIDLGETPTSDTQLVKQLQRCLDGLIYEAKSATNAENKYRVTSHDVAYVKEKYSSKGKKALCVACAKHSYMRSLIADIAAHIVAEMPYGMEYEVAKPKAGAGTPNATTKAADAPKSKDKTQTSKKSADAAKHIAKVKEVAAEITAKAVEIAANR